MVSQQWEVQGLAEKKRNISYLYIYIFFSDSFIHPHHRKSPRSLKSKGKVNIRYITPRYCIKLDKEYTNKQTYKEYTNIQRKFLSMTAQYRIPFGDIAYSFFKSEISTGIYCHTYVCSGWEKGALVQKKKNQNRYY